MNRKFEILIVEQDWRVRVPLAKDFVTRKHVEETESKSTKLIASINTANKTIGDLLDNRIRWLETDHILANRVENITLYHETDINSRGDVVTFLKSELKDIDHEQMFKTAICIASVNGRKIIEHIDCYRGLTQDEKYHIALVAATNHPQATSYSIENLGIDSELKKATVASISASFDGLNTAHLISKYHLESGDYKQFIFRQAVLNDTAAITYWERTFDQDELGRLSKDPKRNEIVEWICQKRASKNNVHFPEAIEKIIYKEVQRNDVAIILLVQSLMGQELNPCADNLDSALLLKNLTGYDSKTDGFASLSPNTKGDIYQKVIAIQQLFAEPFFKDIKLSEDVYDHNHLESYLALLDNLMLLTSVVGVWDRTPAEIIKKMVNGKQYLTEINPDNIVSLNQNLSQAIVTEIGKIKWNNVNNQILLDLIEKDESCKCLLVLATRYSSKTRWNVALPVLAELLMVINENRWKEFKYTDTNRQLEFLNPKQKKEWEKNHLNVELVDINKPEGVSDLSMEILRARLAADFPDEKELIDEYKTEFIGGVDIFELKDKQRTSVLRQLFGTNHELMRAYCMFQLTTISTAEELQKAISKFKSSKDILGIDSNYLKKLTSISDLIFQQNKPDYRVIVTTTFDDPVAMARFGNLIPVASCFNYKNGAQAQAVLANMIDPNTKGIAAFIIDSGNCPNQAVFQKLCKAINNNVSIEFEFDQRSLTLTFKETGGPPAEIKFKHAHQRRFYRVGTTENRGVGIRMEPAALQDNRIKSKITHSIEKMINMIAERMTASTDLPILINKSKSPTGAYSDVAGGPKESSYYMSQNHKMEI